MLFRKIGRTGLKVSAFGIGTSFFGSHTNEADAMQIMDIAFENGINLFDTANIYSGGKSEELVGKFLKNKRHAVVLATKVANRQGPGPNDLGLSRKHIMQAVETSLKRLDTDYIDIYYAHAPDYSTPIEETLRAFDNLVNQGKVRYIACDNFHAWQLIKALWVSDLHNLTHFISIQVPFNLITRDIESELMPFCATEGVGITVYNALAAGLLTGKYNHDQVPELNTRFRLEGIGPVDKERYWSFVNFEAVGRLKQIADAQGKSLTHFSLAWILNNPSISSIIIGVSTSKQLENNIKALEIKKTDDEIKGCDQVWQMLRPSRIFYGH